MKYDYEKLWFGNSLNQAAIARASDAIMRTGKSLPCIVQAVQGSFVTVAFAVDASPWVLQAVTIPKAEGPWIRSPTQVGDPGVAISADVFLGNISGQTAEVPNMRRPGNLGALMWLPVASKAYPAVNPNQAIAVGPDGAVIGTADGSTQIAITNGIITITAGGKTWSFNGSGFTMSTGVIAETHRHGGVQPGSGNSGGPIT